MEKNINTYTGDEDESDYTRHDETPELSDKEWAARQERNRRDWIAVHGGDEPKF